MSEPSILITVLGHHDPARYERALKSAVQAAAHDGTDSTRVMAVVDTQRMGWDLVEVARRLHVPWAAGEWGSPGPAKNHCLAIGSKTARYTWQLDGDDYLHLNSVRILRGILDRHPQLDVAGIYAFDEFPPSGTLDPPIWAGWPTPPVPSGLCQEKAWDDAAYTVPWIPAVFSHRAAHQLHFGEYDRYDDAIMCYKALHAHLRGQLSVALIMHIDMMVKDRCIPGHAGEGVDWARETAALHRVRETYIARHESNWGVLPFIYAAWETPMDIRCKQDTINSVNIPHGTAALE